MERLYYWGDIEDEIAELTPQEGDFTDVYSEQEIDRDKKWILGIRANFNEKTMGGMSDSKIQVYACSQEIVEMDWFHEDQRDTELFADNKGVQSFTVLTSEFDDLVNHTDAICVIDNADTDFRAVPFALDMTYDPRAERLDKKFGWQHKKLGVPGFASIKYYEDKLSFEPPIDKGPIAALPRFVIGFSPELSTEITELRMTNSGWGSSRREELSAKAKWCVLRELKLQAEQMLAFLKEHQDEAKFQGLYQDVQALDTYFGGAIEAAKRADRAHPDWISYPDRDEVFNAISIREIV